MGFLQLGYKSLVNSLSGEKFSNVDRIKNDNESLALLITFLLWIAIILVVSKWLWNDVLCHIVTFTKPVTSVFQILGLIILLEILAPVLN
jgi:hypothetical protein